jgi:hypothetical protein
MSSGLLRHEVCYTDVTGVLGTMEAANTSETSVNFYHTTRHSSSEDSRLHTRRRRNFKSRSVNFVVTNISDLANDMVWKTAQEADEVGPGLAFELRPDPARGPGQARPGGTDNMSPGHIQTWFKWQQQNVT